MKKEQPTKKTEKGYSTKYALTMGIHEVTLDSEFSNDRNYVYTKASGMVLRQQLQRGKTYFTDLEEAKENARKQAVRKVASLEKQLSEMKKLAKAPQLAFTPKEGT